MSKDGYEFVRLEGYIIAPLTGVFNWWNKERKDNFATTASNWVGLPGYVQDGYNFFRNEGKVFSPDLEAPLGTVPLNLWWNEDQKDNVLIADLNRGRTELDDSYELVGRMGYIFPDTDPQPLGAIPLFRWFNPARGDHFTTTNPDWAGRPRDRRTARDSYKFVRIEGFVYPS